MANAFDMLDLLKNAGVDPSTVTKLSSSSTTGNWAISGVEIGKPLYILATNPSLNDFFYMFIKTVSGTEDGKVGTDEYTGSAFLLGNGRDKGSTNCFVVIPTETTVILNITEVSGPTTVSAYQ